MCGFGDKDRRPLAPAAVARMVVRREDNSIVDVDDVDCSFFLVTVDLWSGDGKQETNLVLHPSATDRYVTPNPVAKPARRRNTSSSQQQPSSGSKTPAEASTPTPAQTTPSGGQSYFSSPAPALEAGTSPAHVQRSAQDVSQSWGYPPPLPAVDRTTSFPPPVLPSISSFGRNAPSNAWSTGGSQDSGTYPIDPVLRQGSDSSERRNDTSLYSPTKPDVPETPSHYLPRQAAHYTRTLVGPLSANACRLQDEHRKEGIFFLFQDLSVRTEGTFRLRMRLVNVGAPPAPESGATRVHNDVSPVLAQTFTESFTVYSAKRFPGVPDTTALSIAFGNQGQKLPLRNRHGTSKRRRRAGSGSDDDSE